MAEKLKANKNPEPHGFKPLFYEDWGCAILYFKESLDKIKTILELKRDLEKNEENTLLCRLLTELSTVLLVSAFEWYCSQKIQEIVAGKEGKEVIKIEEYGFQNPADCNKVFKEVAGIEVLRVWDQGDPGDQDKLRRMKILFEKRHCIIHRNSRVNTDLRNMLNQKVAINAKIPLDEAEIRNVMDIMKEFALRVESQYPSPVDWGKEG